MVGDLVGASRWRRQGLAFPHPAHRRAALGHCWPSSPESGGVLCTPKGKPTFGRPRRLSCLARAKHPCEVLSYDPLRVGRRSRIRLSNGATSALLFPAVSKRTGDCSSQSVRECVGQRETSPGLVLKLSPENWRRDARLLGKLSGIVVTETTRLWVAGGGGVRRSNKNAHYLSKS
jgi:hypothetical protein